MKIPFINQRHPSRTVLMDYAQNMVDQKSAISASIAAHLVLCPKCGAETNAVRDSLEFAAAAPALEAAPDSTARILLAAQKERQVQARGFRPQFNLRSLTQALAYAAALLLIAGLAAAPVFLDDTGVITAAFNNLPAANDAPQKPGPTHADDEIAQEIKVLSTAVRAALEQPRTASERTRKRAVNNMDIEIAAAMTALERNPGCVRASRLVRNNRQRQAETLRALYADRSL